jgi:hypothetical protein
MSTDLAARIDALDDKQAIHYATIIANGASVPAETDEEFVRLLLDTARSRAPQAGVTLPEGFEASAPDATLDGREGGPLARSLLRDLALQPGGAEVVEAALREPPSRTADFGIVSGTLLLTLTWLAFTGEVRIKVGGFEYTKTGWSPAQQVEAAKKILPEVVKALFRG